MVAEVRKADFVVVNPDHIAVALRYDRDGERAPVVVASGERLVAERIKQVAREAGVPIFRDVTLARSLRALTEGEEIPVALYEAVAEVLRAVYARERRASRPAAQVRWSGGRGAPAPAPAGRARTAPVAPAGSGLTRSGLEMTDETKRKVRKAVLPVAGLGTRFLPATKAIPRRCCRWSTCRASSSSSRSASPPGSTGHLRDRARQVVPSKITSIARPSSRRCSSVAASTRISARVRKPTELARFSSCGRGRRGASGTRCSARATAVGDEPFAVLLGDDLVDAKVPGIRQLVDVYERLGTGAWSLIRGRGRPGAHVRHRRRRRGRGRARWPDAAGREAGAGHRAVAAGDHRALRAAARDLPDPGRRPRRARRRDSAHRRLATLCAQSGLYGLQIEGSASMSAIAPGTCWRACTTRFSATDIRDDVRALGSWRMLEAADAGRTLLEVAVALPVPGTFTYRDPRGAPAPVGAR